MDTAAEKAVRDAAMTWLDARPPTTKLDYAYLSSFEFEGNRLPLKDWSRGLRHPKGMRGALSISMSVSQKTIRRLIAAGKIPAYKVGGPSRNNRLIRIALKDLEAVLHRIPTAGDW